MISNSTMTYISIVGPCEIWENLEKKSCNICIFVVVNFDALAQASDIQIERRHVVFLCWKQDLNPRPQTPNRQQTECSLTNRLSYRGSSKNLNSAARPYDQRAFSPLGPTFSWLSHLALAIYIFIVVSIVASNIWCFFMELHFNRCIGTPVNTGLGFGLVRTSHTMTPCPVAPFTNKV